MQEHQCKDGNVQIGEIWKDINGYEGRYQVSNFGNVKSLARMRRGKNGSEVPVPEIIMALTPKKDNGRTKPYVEVRLRDGGVRTKPCKSFLVHRLVANAFITPLKNGDQVDHINRINKIGTKAAKSPENIAKMIATKAILRAKKETA